MRSRSKLSVGSQAIDLALIDEPALPMRLSIDPEQLENLKASIAKNGMLQPIVLKPRAGRFEIVAGHRRFIACKELGFPKIEASVRDVDDDSIERLKTAENIDREEVNPAHEAAYYAELYTDRCNQDVDVLCEMVGRKRGYVEPRLTLIGGDKEIYQAVADGLITMSVGLELNKIQNPQARAMYLDSAKKGGASVRSVKTWVTQAEMFDALQAGAAPPPPGTALPPDQPYGSSLNCIVCETNQRPYELIMVYVHRSCKDVVLDRLLQSLGPAIPANTMPGGQ
jgi:ParB family chromosome partitioning protein